MRKPPPLIFAFVGAHRAMKLAMTAQLDGEGLSPEEFDVLVHLTDGEPRTHKAIAARILVPNPTLTRTIVRLVDRGLAQQARGERDGREKLVSLTPQGQELATRAFADHFAVLDQALGALNETETAELQRLLGKLKDGFDGAMRDL